jgi:hypothetical protein
MSRSSESYSVGYVPSVWHGAMPGGIAKAFGFDDGPTHTQGAIVKGQALGDATQLGEGHTLIHVQ